MRIELDFPPAELFPNRAKGTHWGKLYKLRSDYRDSSTWLAKHQIKNWKHGGGNIKLTVTFEMPDKRKRDADNCLAAAKGALDAGQRCVVISKFPDTLEAPALQALGQLGIERGPLLAAERATPGGLLQWRISVRDDGQRLFQGGLPTLIEWGPMHPAATMPGCDITLQALVVHHPQAADLQAAHQAIGLQRVAVRSGPPDLIATLATPRGMVTLASNGT